MKVELRNDSVYIEGYVNAVGRDSRPIRDQDNREAFCRADRSGHF